MRMPTLTLNQQLAAGAFFLGLLALGAKPYPGGTVTIDARELASIVAREVDHVSALDLADWIVQGRSDYRLIDLRDEKAYAEYHIPTSENVPVAQIADQTLLPTDKIVLYSDGGIHSAQAWFLLQARGIKNSYILRGGLDEWKDSVLFPSLAENPTPFQKERDERLKAMAAYFGGTPRVGGEAVAATMPAVAMPKVLAPTAVGPSAQKKKKKKEGC